MRGSELVLAAQLLVGSAIAKPLVKRDRIYARGANCAPQDKPLAVITPKPEDAPITVTKVGQQVYTCIPQHVQCDDQDTNNCETAYSTKTYLWAPETQVPCQESEYCYVTEYDQPITFNRSYGYGDATSVVCPTPGSYWIDGEERYVPQPTSYFYKQKLDSYYVCPYSSYQEYLSGSEASIDVTAFTCVDGKCVGVSTSLYYKHVVTEDTVVIPWQRQFPVYQNGPFHYHDPQYNFDIDITINNAPTTVTFSTTVTSTVTDTITNTSGGTGTTITTTNPGQTGVPVGDDFALVVGEVGGLRKRQDDGSVANGQEEYVGDGGSITTNSNNARAFVINSDGSCQSNNLFVAADKEDVSSGLIPFPLTSKKEFATTFRLGFNNEFQWLNSNFNGGSATFCRQGNSIFARLASGGNAGCINVILRARSYPLFPGQNSSSSSSAGITSTTSQGMTTTTSAGASTTTGADELPAGAPAGPDEAPFNLDFDVVAKRVKRQGNGNCAVVSGGSVVIAAKADADGSNCAKFARNSEQGTLFADGLFTFATTSQVKSSTTWNVRSGSRGTDIINRFTTSGGLTWANQAFSSASKTAVLCRSTSGALSWGFNGMCPTGSTATQPTIRKVGAGSSTTTTTTGAPATTTTTTTAGPTTSAVEED